MCLGFELRSSNNPRRYVGLPTLVGRNRKAAFSALKDTMLELGTRMKLGSGSMVSVWDDVWLRVEGPYKIQSPRVSNINVIANLINKESCWN